MHRQCSHSAIYGSDVLRTYNYSATAMQKHRGRGPVFKIASAARSQSRRAVVSLMSAKGLEFWRLCLLGTGDASAHLGGCWRACPGTRGIRMGTAYWPREAGPPR